MSLLTNLKLNYITNQLKQVENTTANADVLNAVIKYINDNPDKFEPTIDITALNNYVTKYLNDNKTKFQGLPGPPVSQSDITTALTSYLNSTTNITFINASFTIIKQILNNLTCGNTILQFYNPNNQIDEYDLTTNNIQAHLATFSNSLSVGNNLLTYYPGNNTSNNDFSTNLAQITKITCSELHAKTGAVATGAEKITVYDNLNCTGGITTSSLTLNGSLTVGNNVISNNAINSTDTDIKTNNLDVKKIFNSDSNNKTILFDNTGIFVKNIQGILQDFQRNPSQNNPNLPNYYSQAICTVFDSQTKFNQNLYLTNIFPIPDNNYINIGDIRKNTTIYGNLTIMNPSPSQAQGGIGTPCNFYTDVNITGNLTCGSISSRTLFNVNSEVDKYAFNLAADFKWINQVHILQVYSTVTLPNIFAPGTFNTPLVPFGAYVGFIYNKPYNPISTAANNMTIIRPSSVDGSLVTDSIYIQTTVIYIVLGKGYARMSFF